MLGTKRETTPQSNSTPATLLVGPQQVQLLAVNPDSRKLSEIYGKEIEAKSYDLVEKNGYTYRPVTFFLKEVKTGKIATLKVNIYDKINGQPLDKNGQPRNYKIITSTGNVTWAGKKTDGVFQIKPQFEELTPLRGGEDTVIALIQALVGFDYKLNQDYVALTTEMKITATNLFNGEYEGFNRLNQEEYYPDYTFICMFTVSENEGKYYQQVSPQPELFFSDKYGKGPGEWHSTKIKERHQNALSSGYDMFEGLFYDYNSSVFLPGTTPGGVPPVVVEPSNNWND